jgi:hypothetical protein
MRRADLFRAVVLVLTGLSLAVPASAAAQAGCPPQPVAQVFQPWGDYAWYASVDDGGMETQQGAWSLSGPATFELGNEPFFVRSASDRWSAKLKPGAAAVTAPTCIGVGHPTLRLFGRSVNSGNGTLRIAVEYTDLVGTRRSQQLAVLGAASSWGPMPPVMIVANALSLVVPQWVTFRFTADGGQWFIDDVYVDPYGKG